MSPSGAYGGPPAVPIEPADAPSGPTRLGRDDVKVGAAGEPWTAPPLTVTDFVRYQGASGDLNPIHHDESFARAAGYPSAFAVGMLQAGVLGSYVTEWLGPRGVRRLRVQFREQAWPGDEITYSGVVVAVRRPGEPGAEEFADGDADRLLVDVELTAVRQTGGVHLRGWATIAV